MFTIQLHMQTDTLEWLEPLAKHLGHVEVALDYTNDQQPAREPHPVVAAVDEADRELRRIQADQIKKGKTTYQAKLDREAERKRAERKRMAKLSPLVIAAVPCATCKAMINQPCRSEAGEFGKAGHTHIARRQAYEAKS